MNDNYGLTPTNKMTIIYFVPVIIYSFNSGIPIMPIHASYQVRDRNGIKGMYICGSAITLSLIFYLGVIIFPEVSSYHATSRGNVSSEGNIVIETVLSQLSYGFKMNQ
jgi:hypothetical protein